MDAFVKSIKEITRLSWVPEVVSALVAAAYAIRIWIFAHSQDSFLDEGLYLLKGYLFATGEYLPFQSHGPWTNKMPLSFLIPGFVQKVFGPGFRVGRIYAVVVALIFLIGVWIVARRLGGKWGAVGAAAILTLNPAPLKHYSVVLSEGLIAAQLVWVLVFILGKDRPLWQLITGAFLAGLIPLTRINMSPVLPFVLGYIFWEHGWFAGGWSVLAGLVSFLGGHALFWPEIMRLWVPWFPEDLTAYLNHWRPNLKGAQSIRSIDRSFRDRYMSFFEGLRYHFPAIMGIATTWILWPNSWEDKTRFRLAVFLSSLFSALFLIHGYASLFKDFNVFAFSIYLSFFEVLGILLFIATIQEWIKVLPHWKSILVLVILILLSLSVAFSFAKTESAFVEQIGSLLKLHALQIENGSISVAPWRIWEFFKGRLGWSFQTSRVIFSMVILMTIEAIILGGILVIKRQINLNGLPTTFTSTLVISFLCLSIIISPTKVLGGEMHNFNCQPGVISEHVSVAKKVSKHIQEYDTLFWIGVDTQVILLELMRYQDISIFPQQLNSQYSYRSGGDAEILSSYGFWNEELGKSWIEQSDVLFIEQQAVDEWYGRLQQELSLDKFDKVESIPHFGCIPGKKIDLYRRIP